MYVLDACSKSDPNIKFWRCEERRRCKARIYTQGEDLIKRVNIHSHDASVARTEVLTVVTQMKKRATETMKQTNQIMNACTSNTTQAVQVYVIMARKHNSVHPVIYALLLNKQKQTYLRLFEIIKNLRQNINPSAIYCDYEVAAFMAMRKNFPGVIVKGCFFHLAQNMRKNLGKLGLTRFYNEDPEFTL
ncbi:hypothetical protein RN001_010132 [Aquatica leii]|uniref:MULE transposase domain-containing protein n=1 Tax=Aquatica leii TaxID=1421715 RepID=A0AAN7P9J5_9COLE|nr:hypothetical protein RN001_010132 [Aquatica leii]